MESDKITADQARQRREERKARMMVNTAANFAEAERWDLDFWQSVGPEGRLSALVAIHRDVAQVAKARNKVSALTELE